MKPEGPVLEVSGSSRRVRKVSIVKPDGPVRDKSGHKSICPGTCNHTTGIMLR